MGACCSSGGADSNNPPPSQNQPLQPPQIQQVHEQLPSAQPVENVDTPVQIAFPPMPRPLPFSLLYGSSKTAAGSSENREDELHEVKETISQATSEEEDICTICLEEYTVENRHIVTKCGHNFHLNCILAWLERSESCPICDQIILRDDLLRMQT